MLGDRTGESPREQTELRKRQGRRERVVTGRGEWGERTKTETG